MNNTQRSIVLGLIIGSFLGVLLALTNCASAAADIIPIVATVGVFCAVFGATLAALTSWKEPFYAFLSFNSIPEAA